MKTVNEYKGNWNLLCLVFGHPTFCVANGGYDTRGNLRYTWYLCKCTRCGRIDRVGSLTSRGNEK